jgi:hypothetical protein
MFFADYIIRFLSDNEAASYIANELPNFGAGLLTLIGQLIRLSVFWSSIIGEPKLYRKRDIPVYF